jgi:hypothetical protein
MFWQEGAAGSTLKRGGHLHLPAVLPAPSQSQVEANIGEQHPFLSPAASMQSQTVSPPPKNTHICRLRPTSVSAASQPGVVWASASAQSWMWQQ